MTPYFETIKSYAEVPLTNQGIETPLFLEACDGLLKMFDLLGTSIFGFVQADLRENITGVRARYDSSDSTVDTLENLVKSERSEGQSEATGCLVRLLRGLSLTCKSLQHMQDDPNVELYICFQRSYDQVLRPHHSWFIGSLAYMAIRSVPHRREFYSRLLQGGDPEKFDVELAKWLAALDDIVKHLSKFLEQGGFGRV